MFERPLQFLRRLLSDEGLGRAGSPDNSGGSPDNSGGSPDNSGQPGFLQGEDGTTMVEFVLVFPIQLTLTLVILQFALLQYAYLVVQQAADLSARAAAVSDIMGPDSKGMTANDAAARMAARQCALLAPGTKAVYNGGIDDASFTGPNSGLESTYPLEWGGRGFTGGRSKQAYGLLRVATATLATGEATTEITYDYLMPIPVGAQFLILLNPEAIAETAARNGRTVWPISRSGRCVAPWIR
ncbi:MAG: pilus assembly protein [Planctomycetes bacterium]|nr:pilus assembly protein [Planctomycetota bacterium]